MRRLAFLLIAITLPCIGGCEPANEQVRSGTIYLSSAFDFSAATIDGYNFLLDDYLKYPSSSPEKPDIILEQFREVSGDIKPSFSSPSSIYCFALLHSSATLEESLAYFEDLSEIDSTIQYSIATDTVRLYQVYAVRTSLMNYAKLHVRDIRQISAASGDYLDAELDYVYRKDGSRSFLK